MKKYFNPLLQPPVLFSAATGTSAMTLYSYVVSWIKNENFKEPDLLGKLAYRSATTIQKKDSKKTGWLMHYLVGLLFAEAYAPFWRLDKKHSNIKTGLILGGMSGIAAILIWKIGFELHPDPPAINFSRFAGQLFVAHIVFGVFTAAGINLYQKLFSQDRNRIPLLH